MKLDALRLKGGKAETVIEEIAKLIDEYNLWNSIKMIITDTTNVNTRKRNGVLVKLQRMFELEGAYVLWSQYDNLSVVSIMYWTGFSIR